MRTCPARAARPLLALLALAAACKPDDEKHGHDTTTTGGDDTSGVDDGWVEPPELEPDGDGVYQIEFAPSEVEIGGQRYCMRAYNGMVPGPTIRIPAGTDRHVRVDFHNAFTQEDYRLVSGNEGYDAEHCYDFNLTNLHFHGSHVRPEYAVGGDACSGEGCGTNPADDDGVADDYYGDDVLLEVKEGERAKYRWDIDEDHVAYAGLDWYHPHIHGSTGIQLANGAAGAIVIEGDYDALPSLADARERLLVMSHIPWDVTDTNVEGEPYVKPLADGESCTEDTLSVDNFLGLTNQASQMLVNGQVAPAMETTPGAVERWRVVHAGGTDEMYVGLFRGEDEDCESYDPTDAWPLTQIAADGIPFPQSWTRDWVFMSPGYRMEFLVEMPDDDTTLCLVAARFTDLVDWDGGLPTFPNVGHVAAVVHVRADTAATTTSMPATDALDADLASVAPATSWTGTVDGQSGVTVSCDNLDSGPLAEPQQTVVLLHPNVDPGHDRDTPSTGGSCDGSAGMDMDEDTDPCVCPEPNINCRNYGIRHGFESEDGSTYRNDRVLVAGESEHWAISAFDGHPFHIHINPFLVCPTNSTKEAPFPHWRDTLWVQLDDIVANDYEPVHVLTRYPADWTGRYVDHCHKLNHEDEGMMELVETCAPGDTACLCLDGETTEDGECVKPADGCFGDDVACNYAAWVMDGFSPTDLSEDPTMPEDLDSQTRNELADDGLEECCAEFPDFADEQDLADYIANLAGLDPRCCPDFDIPLPPGHPCADSP